MELINTVTTSDNSYLDTVFSYLINQGIQVQNAFNFGSNQKIDDHDEHKHYDQYYSFIKNPIFWGILLMVITTLLIIMTVMFCIICTKRQIYKHDKYGKVYHDTE